MCDLATDHVARQRHALPSGRDVRRDGSGAGDLPAVLPVHDHPAPYFKKYGKIPGVVAFVDGITAAAIGAIAGSVIVIAKRTIVDLPTAVIAVCTIVLLWRFKKLQESIVVAAAVVVGLIIYPLR